MASDDTLRIDPQLMQGFAHGMLGAAEALRVQLAQLDGQVVEILGGWHGVSGDAYRSAWEMWHRGATEVGLGLSKLSTAVGQAGAGYQQNETGSARTLRMAQGG